MENKFLSVVYDIPSVEIVINFNENISHDIIRNFFDNIPNEIENSNNSNIEYTEYSKNIFISFEKQKQMNLLVHLIACNYWKACLYFCNFVKDIDYDIIFLASVKHNCYSLVKYLINKGIDVTMNDNIAIRYNSGERKKYSVEILKLLLDNGADLNTHDNYPLCNSIKKYSFDNFILLLNYGADIKYPNYMPIRLAVLNHLIIDKIFEIEFDINFDNNYLLRNAIEKMNERIIEKLIIRNSDLSVITPSHILYILRYFSEKTIRLLCSHGLDIKQVNNVILNDSRIEYYNFLLNEGVRADIALNCAVNKN